MKFPKRFALSTLLLQMFLVAAAFGFLQWRRQRFLANVEWLNSTKRIMSVGRGSGVQDFQTLTIIGITDGMWPTVHIVYDVPFGVDTDNLGVVRIRFVKNVDGSYEQGDDGKKYSGEELRARLLEIEDRLRAIGIEHYDLAQYEDGDKGVRCSIFDDVNSIE